MSGLLSDRLRTATEPSFQGDWLRQRLTATDILQRLKAQEGVILADQVGMGKTYVALAVAVSQILSNSELGQVVIFVPAAVADKWVREWRKFSESLLEHGHGIRCVDNPIRSGEEFLRKFDGKPEDRDHLIVVTHTALTASLKDTFIQLALLHYATRYVRNGVSLRQRIAKWSSGQSGLIRDRRFTPDRVARLLNTAPALWRATWKRLTGENLAGDPVSAMLLEVLHQLPFSDLRAELENLPKHNSADIDQRLKDARTALFKVTQATWKLILSSTELDLPLIIVDEAHRLKNPQTDISKLFGEPSEDIDVCAFNRIFRRMLFLTATPFELGHSELIEVLSRMGAVRSLDPPPNVSLMERLEILKRVLTEARASALTLDTAWSRLRPEDLIGFDAWGPNENPPAGISAGARQAWEQAKLTVQARKRMHMALQPWVIRHERPRRRVYYPGAAIINYGDMALGGIKIPECSALPFLLAARAQSVAIDEKRGKPLFAYGIASSYEAFRRLGAGESNDGRDNDLQYEDREEDDLPENTNPEASSAVGWYRSEIDRALADPNVSDSHPKVRATVEKAAQLWLEGEKCLIFSWFIKTGETVERALMRRIESLIFDMASKALGTESNEQTRAELDRISERLFRRDAPSFEQIRTRLKEALIESAGHHEDVVDLVVDSAMRHLRTHSYLVRYTPLSVQMSEADVWAGINGANSRNIVLLEKWRLFAERLARARTQILVTNSPNDERDSAFSRIKAALLGANSEDDQGTHRGASLRSVRRAHGGTARDDRERLIALFNTPLSPDLLVASSVMGEGIDLHQECRFVIHHDLDWNPGVLEQRTGRLDRIGSLADRVGMNIEVFEPYLAGTHDEKMYRVVKDRAQWFDIVMGRPTGTDESATDAEEIRIPLHSKIREALAMDLRSPELRQFRLDPTFEPF